MEYIFFSVIVFICGIISGRFLNICIYCIPRGKKIRAHLYHYYFKSTSMNHLRYLWRKSQISRGEVKLNQFLVRALNAVLWVLAFLEFGISYQSVLAMLFISILIIIAFIDYEHMEIPDITVIFIALLGIGMLLLSLLNVIPLEKGILSPICSIDNKWYDYLFGLFAASFPLFLCFIFTRGKGMGYGDVTMMTACGLFLGWQSAIIALIVGVFTATLIGAIPMYIKKKDDAFPFGPYLAIGCIIALIEGGEIMNWCINVYSLLRNI